MAQHPGSWDGDDLPIKCHSLGLILCRSPFTDRNWTGNEGLRSHFSWNVKKPLRSDLKSRKIKETIVICVCEEQSTV